MESIGHTHILVQFTSELQQYHLLPCAVPVVSLTSLYGNDDIGLSR